MPYTKGDHSDVGSANSSPTRSEDYGGERVDKSEKGKIGTLRERERERERGEDK